MFKACHQAVFPHLFSLRNPYRSCSDRSLLRVRDREWNPGPAMRSAGVLTTPHPNHRIYRIPGFHSSCTIWAPSLPHPQESVAPPPFGSKGGDELACEGGVGGTQIRRRDSHSGTPWQLNYATPPYLFHKDWPRNGNLSYIEQVFFNRLSWDKWWHLFTVLPVLYFMPWLSASACLPSVGL